MPFPPGPCRCVNSVQPLAGNGLPDFVISGSTTTTCSLRVQGERSRVPSPMRGRGQHRLVLTSLFNDRRSRPSPLVFAPSPLQGEGWDGGRTFNSPQAFALLDAPTPSLTLPLTGGGNSVTQTIPHRGMPFPPGPCRCVNSVQPLAGNGLPDFVISGSTTTTCSLRVQRERSRVPSPMRGRGQHRLVFTSLFNDRRSRPSPLVFAPSPFKGEGWDGGRTFNSPQAFALLDAPTPSLTLPLTGGGNSGHSNNSASVNAFPAWSLADRLGVAPPSCQSIARSGSFQMMLRSNCGAQ